MEGQGWRTKHTAEVHKRGRVVLKPACVVDYNTSKCFIEISDQMKSYCTILGKLIKWYRKIVIEIRVAIVNAYIVHQKVTNDEMLITSFQEELVCQGIVFSN